MADGNSDLDAPATLIWLPLHQVATKADFADGHLFPRLSQAILFVREACTIERALQPWLRTNAGIIEPIATVRRYAAMPDRLKKSPSSFRR